MKNLILALGLAGICFAAPLAFADVSSSDGLGTWEGTGIAQDVSGSQQTPFTITMVRRSLGGGVVRADGTIHMKDGSDVAFWDEHAERPDGACKVSSSLGNGGGRCFSNHMCQLYTERADGHAFATTYAIDSRDHIRVLVTELQAGKAIRFFSQDLVKKP
ncbi:MAG TPA: hypothetical protein VIF62_33245 [Labilithrix sp.]|jgi:hypothetical protein